MVGLGVATEIHWRGRGRCRVGNNFEETCLRYGGALNGFERVADYCTQEPHYERTRSVSATAVMVDVSGCVVSVQRLMVTLVGFGVLGVGKSRGGAVCQRARPLMACGASGVLL